MSKGAPNPMSFLRGTWSLFLVGLVALAPGVVTGCASYRPDKRVLQYLNEKGIGKRYVGNAQEEEYVTIGDGVQFVDTYNQDLRGQGNVGVDGTIQVPEIGSVFVAGLTRTELEAYLTQKLAPYYVETDIKVTITGGQGRVYYVMGEVANPGPFPFRGDMTVFDAVIEARPIEFSANLSRVKLIRPDPVDPLIIPVDVDDLWERGDSTTSGVIIQEYDVIYVPPTFLQQVANFLSSLITPLTSVIGSLVRVIFQTQRGFGGGGFGGRNNNRFFF